MLLSVRFSIASRGRIRMCKNGGKKRLGRLSRTMAIILVLCLLGSPALFSAENLYQVFEEIEISLGRSLTSLKENQESFEQKLLDFESSERAIKSELAGLRESLLSQETIYKTIEKQSTQIETTSKDLMKASLDLDKRLASTEKSLRLYKSLTIAGMTVSIILTGVVVILVVAR